MHYETIILGAGAAGMMAAAQLNSADVLVIDSQEKVAKKVLISGGGRCNITNEKVSASNYLGDERFIAPIIKAFDQKAVMRFFHSHGLQTTQEKNLQYFCKNSAKDLVAILQKLSSSCHFKLGVTISKVTKKATLFEIESSKGTFTSRKLLLATGGKSYASIGASDIGLTVAKELGHEVEVFEPVLVGLSLQRPEFWMKELSGISCKATICVGKKCFTDQLLFAHKGISGPAVLSASLYWKKGTMSIDFLPDLSFKELFSEAKKLLSNQLPLSKRLALALLSALEVEDKKISRLSVSDKEKLSALKEYTFAPAGNFGFTKAEASRGGIKTTQINGDTMESLLVKDLYFAGEVVDVTGELGGYNFQWAFSSAICASKALKEAFK